MTERERIEQLMKSESLTAKQFADRLGISPSALSNIMNERNKPSLDVMQKVLENFRLVSPDWLISGVGPMYRQKNDSQQLVLIDVKPETPSYSTDLPQKTTSENHRRNFEVPENADKNLSAQKKIQKILVFFNDGTFEEITA